MNNRNLKIRVTLSITFIHFCQLVSSWVLSSEQVSSWVPFPPLFFCFFFFGSLYLCFFGSEFLEIVQVIPEILVKCWNVLYWTLCCPMSLFSTVKTVSILLSLSYCLVSCVGIFWISFRALWFLFFVGTIRRIIPRVLANVADLFSFIALVTATTAAVGTVSYILSVVFLYFSNNLQMAATTFSFCSFKTSIIFPDLWLSFSFSSSFVFSVCSTIFLHNMP